jgi:hypothetical protein
LAILPESIQVKFDGLASELAHLHLGLSHRYAPRQVWHISAVTGLPAFDDHGVLHGLYLNPASFKMLFRNLAHFHYAQATEPREGRQRGVGLTTLAFTGEGPFARISRVHENMPGPSSTCNALLGQGTEDAGDLLPELRYLRLDDLPHEGIVHGEIPVNEPVAHLGDLPPLHLRIRLSE